MNYKQHPPGTKLGEAQEKLETGHIRGVLWKLLEAPIQSTEASSFCLPDWPWNTAPAPRSLLDIKLYWGAGCPLLHPSPVTARLKLGPRVSGAYRHKPRNNTGWRVNASQGSHTHTLFTVNHCTTVMPLYSTHNFYLECYLKFPCLAHYSYPYHTDVHLQKSIMAVTIS